MLALQGFTALSCNVIRPDLRFLNRASQVRILPGALRVLLMPGDALTHGKTGYA